MKKEEMKKEELKIGQRIKLVHTNDNSTQLKPGDLGTVWDISVLDIEIQGQPVKVVWISWDSGSRSTLIEGKDEFEIVKT